MTHIDQSTPNLQKHRTWWIIVYSQGWNIFLHYNSIIFFLIKKKSGSKWYPYWSGDYCYHYQESTASWSNNYTHKSATRYEKANELWDEQWKVWNKKNYRQNWHTLGRNNHVRHLTLLFLLIITIMIFFSWSN